MHNGGSIDRDAGVQVRGHVTRDVILLLLLMHPLTVVWSSIAADVVYHHVCGLIIVQNIDYIIVVTTDHTGK